MNKSAKTTKVYAISLSLIFLANVLFLQGNISVFSIQLAFSEDVPTKLPFITKYGGDNVTITPNTEKPVNFTFTQTRGPDVIPGNNSATGHSLSFIAPYGSSDSRVEFNVTYNQGAANLTNVITVVIKVNHAPILVLDHDQIIDTKKYCNTSNSSQPTQAPQFELNGKGIDEGNLTYFWSALNYQSLINITQHPESPKATFTVKNLCDLVGKTNVIFMLNGTETGTGTKLRSDVGTIMYTFNNPDLPLIDFIS